MTDARSGAELVEALQREARRRGVTVKELARPLSRDPHKYLTQLGAAMRPTAMTVARVEAVLEGREVQPAPPNNFQKSVARAAPLFVMRYGARASETLPPRVDRDPCPRCGVRSDVGCRHRKHLEMAVLG